MIGIDSLLNLADKLEVISIVKKKLIKQPDPASDKLITVLEELSKIYEILNVEISKYLSITFYDGQTPKERSDERARLIELEGNQIHARMTGARGHCSKINNIYKKYLVTWFDSVLSKEESREMESVFKSLEEYDSSMSNAIEKVAYWLSRKAEETLDLVENEKFKEADRTIKMARNEILNSRKAMSKTMSTLLELKTEFNIISGAV